MPDSEQGKLYASDAGHAALGQEAFDALSAQVTTPVAIVTAKDPYQNPAALKDALGLPENMDTSALSKKSFQDKVGTGTPTSTPTGGAENTVCAVSMPEEALTMGQTFNRLAHVDYRAGPPQLDVSPDQPDPGIALSHEIGHCDQKPIAANDPQLTEKILAGEVDADKNAKATFPHYAGFIDNARALGGQHDSMSGDVDHSVALYAASGSKLSAADIAATHDGLNQKIGQTYAADPRADPERTTAALRYALHDDNLAQPEKLGADDVARLQIARQQVGTRHPQEVLKDLPEHLRQTQGIDQSFYGKTAEYMPRDPRLIADQINKIDPARLSPNEKLAADLYTDAADKFYPRNTASVTVNLPQLDDTTTPTSAPIGRKSSRPSAAQP